VAPVLVTGAGGFAGGHLLEHLRSAAAEGAEALLPAAPSSPARIVGWTRADVDLLDREAVRRAVADLRPSQVYHLAGAADVARSWTHTAETLAANVLGTHHLLDALRRTGGACRVFIPGSAHVYQPSPRPLGEDAPLGPASPYAMSKLAQEQLALRAVAEDGVETIVARVFNHTGPRQSPAYAAPSMARQLAGIERGQAEPVIKVGNLEAVRDLTDVRDTVRAYALLMARGVPGIVYNVASGTGHRAAEILETLLAAARVKVTVERDPARLRPSDVPVLVGDPTRLRAATGWHPRIAFERMLRDLLDYWRTQP
jgi:GDP-4-dehydro-6-deoxy-D-mannose reductase